MELPGDPQTVHTQVIERLLNGYFRDAIAQHERDRVFQEICEELTIHRTFEAMKRGDMPGSMIVTTISDFAHPLGEAAEDHGYRAENKKGMVRSTSLAWRNGTYVRVIRQLSRSNTYAPETLQQLQQIGIRLPERIGHSDVQLLGIQLLSVKEGAIEVTKKLDRQQGVFVRFGEIARTDTPDYDEVERLSAARESQVGRHVHELADYEKSLDSLVEKGMISKTESLQRYVNKTRDIVRTICVQYPGYTKDALGEAVVASYEEAHALYETGDYIGAAGAIARTASLESEIAVCGGSSKKAEEEKMSEQQALTELIERMAQPYNGEKIDTCMTCPKCQKTGVKITYQKGEKFYTCISSGGCGASTLPPMPQKRTLRQRNNPMQRPIPTAQEGWLVRERLAHKKIAQTFGAHAVTKQQIGIGTATSVVVHRWTGDVIRQL